MVNVERQERTRNLVATPALDLLAEGLSEAAAVGEARQVVAVGLRAQTLDRQLVRDELVRPCDEQGEFRRQLEVIRSARGHRLAAPLGRGALAADEHDGYGVLRVGEHPREFGGADPLKLLIGDDDVGARALQRDERLRAARHARDDEAALFKRLSVGADGGVVGHEQNAALVARRRATTVFGSSCCAHVQTSGCLYPAD